MPKPVFLGGRLVLGQGGGALGLWGRDYHLWLAVKCRVLEIHQLGDDR